MSEQVQAQADESTLGEVTVEIGFCQCGCGERTEIASYTRRDTRWLRGHPKPYVRFHHLHGNQNRRIDGPEYLEEDRGYTTPCWIWQKALNRAGYGIVRIDGRTRLAYVVYFRRLHPDPPSGYQRDHLCRQPACVRPDHIEVVPAIVNLRRSNVTKLTECDVRQIRQLGLTTREIVEHYGIDRTHAHSIRTRRWWRDVE